MHYDENTETLSFRENGLEACESFSKIMSIETGGINDQVSPYFHNVSEDRNFPAGDIRCTTIHSKKGNHGFELSRISDQPFRIAHSSLESLANPGHSKKDRSGNFLSVAFFPKSIAEILKLKAGAELVFVPAWAANTVFDRFHHPERRYGLAVNTSEYRQQYPSLSLQYYRFLMDKKIPMVIAHDLGSHVAGFNGDDWSDLIQMASRASDFSKRYYDRLETVTMGNILPAILVGTIVDAYSQPLTRPRRPNIDLLFDSLLHRLEEHFDTLVKLGEVKRFSPFYRAFLDLAYNSTLAIPETKVQGEAFLEAFLREHAYGEVIPPGNKGAL